MGQGDVTVTSCSFWGFNFPTFFRLLYVGQESERYVRCGRLGSEMEVMVL